VFCYEVFVFVCIKVSVMFLPLDMIEYNRELLDLKLVY